MCQKDESIIADLLGSSIGEDFLIQIQAIDDLLHSNPEIVTYHSTIRPIAQFFCQIPPQSIENFADNIVSITDSIFQNPDEVNIADCGYLDILLHLLNNTTFTGKIFSIIERMITKDNYLWAERFMNAVESIPLEGATTELRHGMINFFWKVIINFSNADLFSFLRDHYEMLFRNIEYIEEFIEYENSDLLDLQIFGCLTILDKMSAAPDPVCGYCNILRESDILKRVISEVSIGPTYSALILYLTEWFEPITSK